MISLLSRWRPESTPSAQPGQKELHQKAKNTFPNRDITLPKDQDRENKGIFRAFCIKTVETVLLRFFRKK
jgi:hypothetical protein